MLIKSNAADPAVVDGHLDTRSRFRALRYVTAVTLVAGGIGLMAIPSGATTGDAPISGTVYRDANSNGRHDAHEAGQGGVTVTATDTAGASTTTASAADGTYSLAPASLGAGPFRVEFSGWAGNLQPAPHGSDNPTSVSVAGAGAKVDFGLIDPDDYCQANPTMVVSCFVAGVQGSTNLETVASFPYGAGTTETSVHDTTKPGPAGFDQPDETKLASLGQTGSIYGEGWHAQSQTLYLGAYAKKFVPFGPAGSGAIYVRQGSGAPTVFYSSGSTTNRTVVGGNWYADPWNDQIGKVGWGDIDVIGNRLYAVNLEDRALYRFDLDPTSGALVGSGPSAIIPIPQVATNPADARPFGLGSHNGMLYVGGVDSAQVSGGTPSAWVTAFNPAITTFAAAPVAQFSLGFNRGCAYVVKTALSSTRCSALDGSANWRAWGTPPSSADGPDLTNGGITRTEVDPQPMVSDIAFDDNGDMSLGFRDRFGDQSGRLIPSGTTGGVPLRTTSYTFGDTLRLARTGATFTLENNGTSGGVTGTANDGMGPGGGEFYSGDNSLYNVTEFGVPALEGHDEVTSGALHHQPATPELATTAYDVFGRWDTLGVRFMTDTGNDAPAGGDSTNLNVRAYAIYTGTQGGTTPFGKANGLGDLEALCDQAPIELGNYVWFDADHDGIQDSTEKPIPGVKVTLTSATGAALATAITDSTGQYWFVSAGAPNLPTSPDTSYGIIAGGVQPGTSYSMTFDASSADTAALGVAASALQITVAGQGTDTTNSKPTVSGTGLPMVAVHTGGPGANDHTFDAGFDATAARVSIVKSVNGQDANTAPGPTIEVPGTATFTYLVTDSGELPLTKVAVTDDKLGAVTCPKGALAVGEAMTCTANAKSLTGQYTNTGTVTGTAPDSSVATATDNANYFGQPTGVLDTTTIAGGDTTGATLTGLDSGTSNSGGSSAASSSSAVNPSGSLAHTGGNTRGITLIGVGMLLAGIGVILTTRRSPLRPADVPVVNG